MPLHSTLGAGQVMILNPSLTLCQKLSPAVLSAALHDLGLSSLNPSCDRCVFRQTGNAAVHLYAVHSSGLVLTNSTAV
jgi:hypothetical protein